MLWVRICVIKEWKSSFKRTWAWWAHACSQDHHIEGRELHVVTCCGVFQQYPSWIMVQEMVYSEYSRQSYLQCTCGSWLNNDGVMSTCPSATQEFNKQCSSAFGGLCEFSWAAEAIYQLLQLSISSCCNLCCMWQWRIEFDYINPKKCITFISLLPL